jgi:hypothetical protein
MVSRSQRATGFIGGTWTTRYSGRKIATLLTALKPIHRIALGWSVSALQKIKMERYPKSLFGCLFCSVSNKLLLLCKNQMNNA